MCQEALRQTSSWVNALPHIVSVVATLAAAFGGAWFAFLLQNRKEEKRENNKNARVLNLVQFNLIQQLNSLLILQKNYIDPIDHIPFNWIWFSIPALPIKNYSQYKINNEDLTFLAEKGYSSLIQKILLTEELFYETIQLLNYRSDTHVNTLQPKLKEEGFIEGKDPGYSYEKFEEKIGHTLVLEFKRMTNDLILFTENTIISHEKIIGEIKTVGSKIFPENKIVTIKKNAPVN